jgi:hypothetical protein
MKHLLATVCTLAAMFAAAASQAQAKGGGAKSTTVRATMPVPATYQRDHRVPYVGPGGGASVRPTCRTMGAGCHFPHNH